MRRLVQGGTALTAALMLLAGCGGFATDDPSEPSTADGEDVVIETGDLDLVGTLRTPEGDGPFPGVVIVHGSGPLSRDGAVPGELGLTFTRPVPVYRALAESLAEQGYAVLTWDKRTCGPFNGCADNAYPTPAGDLTFETLRDDAAAAVEFLVAREDISDVAVIGHSKGGTVSAGLLEQHDEIDALVLLASPAADVPDLLDVQAEKFAELVADSGQQSGAAQGAVEDLRDLAAQVRAIGDGEVDGPPLAGASRAFWASYIEASREAPGQVAASDVPVLALGGELDRNVPPAYVQEWSDVIGDRGEVVILPNVTHALTRLATGDVAELGPGDIGGEVDPSVTSAIVDWLRDTL